MEKIYTRWFVCCSCISEIIIPVKSSQLEVIFERRNNFCRIFFFLLKDGKAVLNVEKLLESVCLESSCYGSACSYSCLLELNAK